MTHFQGRVVQDGLPVANVSAPTEAAMLRELHHYAAVYRQDGPVRLETRHGKSKWRQSRHAETV